MLAKIWTPAFSGIDVIKVSVEVMISSGLPKFAIVGLPDKAISEAKERIQSAFSAMGFSLPAKRIIRNYILWGLVVGSIIIIPKIVEKAKF